MKTTDAAEGEGQKAVAAGVLSRVLDRYVGELRYFFWRVGGKQHQFGNFDIHLHDRRRRRASRRGVALTFVLRKSAPDQPAASVGLSLLLFFFLLHGGRWRRMEGWARGKEGWRERRLFDLAAQTGALVEILSSAVVGNILTFNYAPPLASPVPQRQDGRAVEERRSCSTRLNRFTTGSVRPQRLLCCSFSTDTHQQHPRTDFRLASLRESILSAPSVITFHMRRTSNALARSESRALSSAASHDHCNENHGQFLSISPKISMSAHSTTSSHALSPEKNFPMTTAAEEQTLDPPDSIYPLTILGCSSRSRHQLGAPWTKASDVEYTRCHSPGQH